MVEPVRTLVVWCPDWALVAAGIPLDVPAAALHANRVVACTPAARAEGVTFHQRRRDAQARCPDLVVVEDDPAASARAFEPVAAALETLTPRLEVVGPGCCAVPTRGPSRYHGGDHALAQLAATVTTEAVAAGDLYSTQVGIADGIFAATLAARHAAASGLDDVHVVPPGDSAAFLAPLPLAVLDRPDLVEVLRRLGLRRLGDLAALPVAQMVGRFGSEGLAVHRLASGLDERPPATTPPPTDLHVVVELDPPVDRVEAAAFVVRGLADELHRRLNERGSACTRLVVGAETEHGERHERLWRTEGIFGPATIADRLRWQLEGWLQQAHAARPTGPLARLWLVPDEVVPAGGRQLSFSTGSIDQIAAGERAGRALARVQGLVGIDTVTVPEWRGGRGPGERITWVPGGAADLTEPRPAARPDWVDEPWPGAVPDPGPAVVHPEPVPAEVLDGAGRPVRVSGRGELSADPATLAIGGGRPLAVVAWSAPWPCEERWWDPVARRRRARLQLLVDDTRAYLLVLEKSRWSVEATYD